MLVLAELVVDCTRFDPDERPSFYEVAMFVQPLTDTASSNMTLCYSFYEVAMFVQPLTNTASPNPTFCYPKC